MKRCPECRRDYLDDSLLYCLEDGSALVQGSVPSPDEPQTAILHETAEPSEATTRAQIHATEPEPQRTSVGWSEKRSFSANRAAKPLAVLAAGLLVLVGGFVVYRYISSGTGRIDSIAVMPFVNDSGNAEADYLSDGMTETLISSLSRLPDLNIKPRSVVFRYKGKDMSPEVIGGELGVEAILVGRVAQRGGDLSLFAELIDVASTKVIWSRRYDRKQSDIVALQSEVTRDVSGKINSGLSDADEQKVTKSSTDNPEAYRLYLLANSLAVRRKAKDLRTALEYYQQAIAIDPNYAPAYVGVGSSHVFLAIYGGEPGVVELPKAREAVSRALEIDPTLAEAYNILGGIELYLNRDFAANERLNARALELNPKFANAHRHNGIRLAWMGEFDKAIAAFRRSLELDPLSIAAHANLSWCYFFAGRVDESDAELANAQQIDPTFWFVELQLFTNARARRDHTAAVEHLARTQELRGEPEAAKFIRDTFARSGWTGMLRASVAEPERFKVWNYYLATFAVELGEKKLAFEFLRRAEESYDQFVFFAKVDPAMEPLRADPRYSELLRRLGFPGQ